MKLKGESKGERRVRERKKVNYLLKVEVWSTKARKFSGIRVIRRILKIVIMKSAARRTRESFPTPDPLFRYFPNTEFPFESHQPAAGYLTTRGIKRIKEGRNCRLTLSFPTCRALDSSMESSAVDNESVSTPVDREQRKRGEKRERETEKGKEGKEGKEISRVNFHRAKGRKGGCGERGRKSVPRRPGETINSACCSIFHRAICKSRE